MLEPPFDVLAFVGCAFAGFIGGNWFASFLQWQSRRPIVKKICGCPCAKVVQEGGRRD